MKRLRFVIILMLIALISSPAYASVGIKLNGTTCGTATDISFATGTNITTDGSTYNITLTTTAGNMTSGTIITSTIDNSTIGLTTAAAANFTNVSLSGKCNITGNLSAGNATVSGISAPATLNVTNNATVNGNLTVVKNATLNGTLLVTSNQTCGNATLLNGTILINSTAVTNNSLVFLTRSAVNTGTTGTVYVLSRNAGVNFTLNSTAATDNSTMNYLIIN